MNYFKNQNKIQLCGVRHKRCRNGETKPGDFVRILGDESYNMGNSFKCTFLDMRALAVDLTSSTPKEYYNCHSQDYKAVMLSEMGEGVYGAEIAMRVDGVVYIYFFCNKSTRMLIGQVGGLIGESVFIESVLHEREKFCWHVPSIWVPAGRVESLVPIHEEE